MIEPDQGHSVQASDLLKLHDSARLIIDSSTLSHSTSLGRLLQLDVDIKIWEEHLQIRPESKQLTDARRELGFAIYAAASGLYGLAYGGLRLFLELSFATVYFSAHEYERRKWTSDRIDFSWSKALNPDSGVLSEPFVQEFNKDATMEALSYAKKSAECYRECSQFIHGKLSNRATLPTTLSYSSSVLAEWATSATSAAESVLFLLFCRYGNELIPQDDGPLRNTLEHNLLHLTSVRKALALPVD